MRRRIAFPRCQTADSLYHVKLHNVFGLGGDVDSPSYVDTRPSGSIRTNRCILVGT